MTLAVAYKTDFEEIEGEHLDHHRSLMREILACTRDGSSRQRETMDVHWRQSQQDLLMNVDGSR